MPGYLSNRRISFDPTQEVADLDTDLTAVEARVTEAEANDLARLVLSSSGESPTRR